MFRILSCPPNVYCEIFNLWSINTSNFSYSCEYQYHSFLYFELCSCTLQRLDDGCQKYTYHLFGHFVDYFFFNMYWCKNVWCINPYVLFVQHPKFIHDPGCPIISPYPTSMFQGKIMSICWYHNTKGDLSRHNLTKRW